MHKTRVTILGIVQTMDLRDKIKAVADGLGVCGTVENLRDGSVLVVCEAERPDIEEMVRRIRSGAEPAVIEDVLVEEGPPATGMEGFEIMRGDSAKDLLYAWSSWARAMVAALNVMRQGQAQTNETLARMEQGREELRRGKAETKDVIKSMDSKLDASLENYSRSLGILRGLRDGGLLRVS